MTAHARFSPSGAHRWMACPGSLLLEAQLPQGRNSTSYADEGTAAHHLAALCLRYNQDAAEYRYCQIAVSPEGASEITVTPEHTEDLRLQDCRIYPVADLIDGVQVYLDNLREYVTDNVLLIEQRVEFSQYIGVPESFGTADAVVIVDNGTSAELQVHDLKFGRGVRVDAEQNKQLMLYALGVYDEQSLLYDISRVRLVIHQPRLEHLSEWDLSIEDLAKFGAQARAAAQKCQAIFEADKVTDDDLTPGESQCKFCKAKATCPKLSAQVAQQTGADFTDLTKELPAVSEAPSDLLAQHMAAVDLIEGWCKAVRAETERRLLEGQDVAGWKLVKGRAGARKWTDEAEAEAVLKKMRIKHDEMYQYKVISPTAAEKLAKAQVIGPRQWPALQALITKAEGGPSVAPVSDPRAVFNPRSVDDFDTVST